MSAYVIGNVQVDALLTAGMRLDRHGAQLRWKGRHGLDVELSEYTADAIGKRLLAENVASLNHLYRCNDPVPDYTYRPVNGTPDPLVALKLLYHYEYQSCEHPGWDGSEAKRFCDSLRYLAVRTLPGYSELPWGTNSREVFTRKAA